MKRNVIVLSLFAVLGVLIYMGIQVFKEKPMAQSFIPNERSPQLVSIESASASRGLIPVDAVFSLIVDGAINENDLKEGLVLDPPIDFNLNKKTETLYELTPVQELSKHQVIRFSYKNQDRLSGWAFQTVDTFRVKSSYPANDSQNLAVNTGIEIEFTQTINDEVKSYIEISPPIEYQVKIEGTRALIIPEHLEKDVRYVVTLHQGYTPNEEDPLTADHVFSFSTGEVSGYNGYAQMNIEIIPSNMPKKLQINNYDSTTQFDLYAIKDAQQYQALIDIYIEKAQYYKNPGTVLSLESLQLLISEPIIPLEEEYSYYMTMPEDLENGYYLVKMGDMYWTQYTFVQISDYTVYAEKTKDQILFFSINVNQNNVLTAGSVHGENHVIGAFEDDGVCIIKDELDLDYYTIDTGDERLYLPMGTNLFNNWGYYFDEVVGSGMNFLYTDRPTYRLGDSMHIFGTFHGGEGNIQSKVQLRVSEYWNSDEVLIEKELSLSALGSFITEIALDELDFGTYGISVYRGNTLLEKQLFSIQSYTLPEFQISQSIDKEVVRNNEKIHISGEVLYFDGTPLKHYPLTITSGEQLYDLESGQVVETNQWGFYEADCVVQEDYENWRPKLYTVQVGNSDAENTEHRVSGSVYLFPTDMSIRCEMEQQGEHVDLTVSTHNLFIPENMDDFGEDYKSLDREGLNQDVQVVIEESYFEKVSQGFKYDSIRKVNVESFKYNYIEKTLLDTSIQTIDGFGELSFTSVEGRSYRAKCFVDDYNGRRLLEETYLYTDRSNTGTIEKAYFSNEEILYSVGDSINRALVVPDNSNLEKDKTLFIVYKDGYLNHTVNEEAVYRGIFDESLVPNAILKAVYYDGYSLKFEDYCQIPLKFNNKDKALTLVIDTDQDSYDPGDEATITVKSYYKEKPINAEVVINIVDEAYYALFGDESDILKSLYAYNYQTGVSHFYYPGYLDYLLGMAEGSGDEEFNAGYLRSNFKETAYFGSVLTNDQGLGTLSFVLPDNLTTWRITAQGVSKDLEAGMSMGALKVSQPFFIKQIYSEIYLDQEKPSIMMRADGEGIKGSDSVEYRLKLTNPDGKGVETALTGQASRYSGFDLGLLQKGSYHYILEGQKEALYDGVEGDFEVITSRVSFDAFMKGKFDQGFKLEPSAGLRTLTIWNAKAVQYSDLVMALLLSDTDRIEWIIAEAEAYPLLYPADQDPWFKKNALNLIPEFIDYSGGVKPLKNAEPDLLTTVKIIATHSDYLNKQNTIRYLESVLEGDGLSTNDAVIALWGLACYDEPVLYTLKSFDNSKLDALGKIYLARALATLGDLETAFSIYSQYNLDETSLLKAEHYFGLANLGTHFQGDSSCEQWFNKAEKSRPKIHAYQLDQVQYLKNVKSDLEEATVLYEIDGNSQEVVMSDNQPVSISILDQESFVLKKITGDVNYHENYIGTLDTVSQSPALKNKMTKTLSTTNPALSDIVTVTIKVQVGEKECYFVYDSIPSGFVLVEDHFSYDKDQLSFYVDQLNPIISYRIRAKQVGSYLVEPAVLSAQNEKFAFTEPLVLTVTGD